MAYIELPRFTKKLRQLKTFFEQWIFLIGRLHELDKISKKFRNKVFEKLFEEAKTARMTKEKKNNYLVSLKNLRSMNTAKIEINKLNNALAAKDMIIATMGKELATKDKDLATKDKDLAIMDKIIAEYKQKYGELN